MVKTLIEQIQELELEALGDPDISTDMGKTTEDGVARVFVVGEIDVMYNPGASGSAPYARKLSAMKQRLKTLIDPNFVLGHATTGGNILW